METVTPLHPIAASYTAENGQAKRHVEYRLCIDIFYVYMDVLGAPKKFVWNGLSGCISQNNCISQIEKHSTKHCEACLGNGTDHVRDGTGLRWLMGRDKII